MIAIRSLTVPGQGNKPCAIRGEYPAAMGRVVHQPLKLMLEPQVSLTGSGGGIKDQQPLTRGDTP